MVRGKVYSPNPTARELDCLRKAAQGWTKKASALQLGLSLGTVRAHLFHACRRLGVSNVTQACVWLAHQEEERDRMQKEYRVVVALAELIATDTLYPNRDHLVEATIVILTSPYHGDVRDKVAQIRGMIRATS